MASGCLGTAGFEPPLSTKVGDSTGEKTARACDLTYRLAEIASALPRCIFHTAQPRIRPKTRLRRDTHVPAPLSPATQLVTAHARSDQTPLAFGNKRKKNTCCCIRPPAVGYVQRRGRAYGPRSIGDCFSGGFRFGALLRAPFFPSNYNSLTRSRICRISLIEKPKLHKELHREARYRLPAQMSAI